MIERELFADCITGCIEDCIVFIWDGDLVPADACLSDSLLVLSGEVDTTDEVVELITLLLLALRIILEFFFNLVSENCFLLLLRAETGRPHLARILSRVFSNAGIDILRDI